MFDNKGRFIIENYNKQSTFSSFLPGISGIEGIPIWCFYVNRGQAVTSFGIEDKNHSIMEFYPAHQAYQITKIMGFRTFLKINGAYYEPFISDNSVTKMYVGMNELEIEEVNTELSIQINILYYTLPNEKIGGLIRSVKIKNLQDTEVDIELVDGMPAVIPYGIELQSLKEMAQTMKAWMQVEDTDSNQPYYRVRFSTKDSSVVTQIEEGNYFFTVTQEGMKLPIIVDPELIFEYDTAYQIPVGFLNGGIKSILSKKQIMQNQVPSGFSCYSKKLGAKETRTLFTVIGQAANKKLLKEFASNCTREGFFDTKYKQARNLTKNLSDRIEVKTSNPIFDSYCRQTYIDNVLRGGFPIILGKENIFYIYSRKHGDIERDYNFFRMLPEYYSQGNGNFRDVNQNRRCDVLFTPYTKDYNIKAFYNLIQLDGYNPLIVKQVTYKVNQIIKLDAYIEEGKKEKVNKFLINEFSPGKLIAFVQENDIKLLQTKDKFLEYVINHSSQQLNADFGEGYWCDHWTYNLDLVETYLSIYPEEEKRLLFEDCSYTYYESRAVVLPRDQRYVETEKGVRQYHFIDEKIKKDIKQEEARINFGTGEIYCSNLMTKLLVIAQNKFATLDMYGLGIEMEAGKPGWYDAMNGLPGIFGSSMAETYELLRLLQFMLKELETYKIDITVFVELYDFVVGTQLVLTRYQVQDENKMWVWNELNILKEAYREKINFGIGGLVTPIDYMQLLNILRTFSRYIEDGIQKASEQMGNVPSTYFAYELTDYKVIDKKIVPTKFNIVTMPLFLEGPVHCLKLPHSMNEKKQLYNRVKVSSLYDKKLGMYKVNESLEKASFEVGRAKAFSPGWLENESIWMHMEYKYLLELLKSGLYHEFFEDFYKACVPFMKYETYGRSLLENSSFIASSANGNEKIHGKGFVARLSGSTAEFLQIWQIMMFGKDPFRIIDERLVCSFAPAIPAYLIPHNKIVETTFLGSIKVIYQFNQLIDIIPTKYKIDKIKVQFHDGKEEQFEHQIIGGTALRVRNGMVKAIVCSLSM